MQHILSCLSGGVPRLNMEPFILYPSQGQVVPIVANLPHSGMIVPAAIAAQFTPIQLQSLPHTDWHLDQLYRSLPALGITVLQATHSRYVVDLNRPLQDPIFGNFWTSVIPEQTAFGNPIYATIPSTAQLQSRIETFYTPYHQKLTALLEATIAAFGKVYLLDLHSFFGPITEAVCLGDRNGKTCSEFLITAVETQFSQHYSVVRNKVFNGGYITGHYGQMAGVEALQIEVRYHTYLNEDELERSHPPNWNVPKFNAAKQTIDAIFAAIVQDLRQDLSFDAIALQ